MSESGASRRGETEMSGVTESDFQNLPVLLTISTLSGLLPLPLIGLLDDASHGSDDDTED